MLLAIIRKEIVAHVLSLRFGVTFILFILLVFASIYVTCNQYQQQTDIASAVGHQVNKQMDDLMKIDDPEDRLDRLEWSGRLDVVPVTPLATIVQGLRPVLPVAISTSVPQSANVGSLGSTNPLGTLFGVPDFQYVVSVVLSLLAILFAFDSVCGEKESGTLRLMLANSLPRYTVLLGKWIGGYVVLILPFLLAVGGAGLYVYYRGLLPLDGDTMARLGMLLAVACIYISVFFTLSLLISCLTHRAATSLFICLLVWVAWILVIPNIAPVIGKIVSPAPSLEKINALKKVAEEEIKLEYSREALRTAIVNYGTKADELQNQCEKKIEAQNARLDQFFESKVKAQTEIAQTISRISPAGCWTYSAVALTNTGPDAYKCLEQGQKKLKSELDSFVQSRWREGRRTGKVPVFQADQVPQLRVVMPDCQGACTIALNDILVLVVLNVVFFMGAMMFFLRYDVR